MPRAASSAFFTTPGPLTPTFITVSASVTPWKAPAINGLSSGALQKTTSFAHPKESLSFVYSAVFLIIPPSSLTASILIPVLVEPTLNELQTRSVAARACGTDSIKNLSAAVIPLHTSALYPPIKFTPTSFAAASRVFAISTKSSGLFAAAAPTSAIGVTDMRLFTTGIPNSFSIAAPVGTSSFAVRVILS